MDEASFITLGIKLIVPKENDTFSPEVDMDWTITNKICAQWSSRPRYEPHNLYVKMW